MTNNQIKRLDEDFIRSFLSSAAIRVPRKVRKRIRVNSWFDLPEDDLAQEAILKLCEALWDVNELAIKGEIEWYCRGVENYCIENVFRNAILKKKYEPITMSVSVDELSILSTATPDRHEDEVRALIRKLKDELQIPDSDIVMLLTREILQFPRSARNIMILLVIHQHSIKEVAEIIKTSLAYVYCVKNNYMCRLKKLLLRWWEEQI